MHSISSYWQVIMILPWYIVLTCFASLTGYEDEILKIFVICTFKDPKLAQKWTNLAENLKKRRKKKLPRFQGVYFFQVWCICVLVYLCMCILVYLLSLFICFFVLVLMFNCVLVYLCTCICSYCAYCEYCGYCE